MEMRHTPGPWEINQKLNEPSKKPQVYDRQENTGRLSGNFRL
jgi:hypothetical protein